MVSKNTYVAVFLGPFQTPNPPYNKYITSDKIIEEVKKITELNRSYTLPKVQ